MSIKEKIIKLCINLIPIRSVRKKLKRKYCTKYYFKDCFINNSVFLEHPEWIEMGKYVCIHGDCKLFPSPIAKIKFGNNIFVAMNTVIYTTSHNYENENMVPFDYSDLCRPVEIGDNVWIGSHCLIMPGVRIDEGAVVAAGSVVTKSVPKCCVVAGNPAKIVKKRDIELYEKLKNNGLHPGWEIGPNDPKKQWILKDYKEYMKE